MDTIQNASSTAAQSGGHPVIVWALVALAVVALAGWFVKRSRDAANDGSASPRV